MGTNVSNLEIWSKVSRPPRQAPKRITGGNPQWRFKIMTETFGPCGKGWDYTIDKLWTEPGPEGTVMAFALVTLHVNTGATPSLGIPGIGGSTMIAQEKAG